MKHYRAVTARRNLMKIHRTVSDILLLKIENACFSKNSRLLDQHIEITCFSTFSRDAA